MKLCFSLKGVNWGSLIRLLIEKKEEEAEKKEGDAEKKEGDAEKKEGDAEKKEGVAEIQWAVASSTKPISLSRKRRRGAGAR